MEEPEDTESQPQIRERFIPVAVILVCAIGACFGAMVGRATYPEETSAILFGGLGGAVAGLIWSWVMTRRIRELGFKEERFVETGVLWGIVVGLVATAVLHAGALGALWLTSGPSPTTQPSGEAIKINWGFVIGIVASVAIVVAVMVGGATGTICAVLWKAMLFPPDKGEDSPDV
jgi:hypothetical protein